MIDLQVGLAGPASPEGFERVLFTILHVYQEAAAAGDCTGSCEDSPWLAVFGQSPTPPIRPCHFHSL